MFSLPLVEHFFAHDDTVNCSLLFSPVFPLLSTSHQNRPRAADDEGRAVILHRSLSVSVWERNDWSCLSCDSSSASPAFNKRDSFLNASWAEQQQRPYLSQQVSPYHGNKYLRLTRFHDPHLLSQVLFRFQTPGGWTTNFLCSFVTEKNTQWSLPVPHVTCKIHHNNVVGGRIALSFLSSTSVLKY